VAGAAPMTASLFNYESLGTSICAKSFIPKTKWCIWS
jgi:hypothetical protein